MKTKAAVAILLLAIFALSSITMTHVMPVKASGSSSNTLSLSDAELGTQFAYEVGPATLAGVTDVPGTGVQFDFTGLDPSLETVVGDNFPVDALAGGTYKDYGYGFAGPYDFSGYNRYSMCICNVGLNPVTVAVKINTGWTVDWSGGQWKGPDGFGASLTRDTLWRSDWVTLNPGECKVVCLDFSNATCYHAWDDPVAAWQHPDGTKGVPVQRLDEVSEIGFRVLGNGAGSIIVKGTQLYIDPPVVNKAPGDVGSTFNVSVTLENFANLAGFDIKLTWNGTLITRTGVDYNTTLDALWGAGNWSVGLEQSGVGFYRLVAVALATSASNLGASALFTLTFHVDISSASPLQTPIHFEIVSLSDNSVPVPNPICAVVTDGMYIMSGIVGVHDVAVTNVAANRTWVYQGKPCGFSINVTVLNKGDFTESVAVTLYYNITASKIIGTQTIALLSGQNQTIVFTWNTTGVECCHNYTLTAVATIPVDNNPADNTFTDGNVKVRILGDVNDDGKVGMDDVVTVLDAFGSYSAPTPHPRWNPDADFDQNGKIDMADIVAVLTNFGKTC